jgi:hypothetical protein
MLKAVKKPPFYNTNSERHWNYFRSLEDDFEATDRYVEICGDNFNTYSIEYTRLFVSICSEVDVCLKILCDNIRNGFAGREMKEYRKEIMSSDRKHYPNLVIGMRSRFISCQPWEDWACNKAPDWWDAYNDVKHRRNEYYAKANLQNTLEALAAC